MKAKLDNCSLVPQRQIMEQDNTLKTTVDTQVRFCNLETDFGGMHCKQHRHCLMKVFLSHSFAHCSFLSPQIPAPTETTTTTPCDEEGHHEDN